MSSILPTGLGLSPVSISPISSSTPSADRGTQGSSGAGGVFTSFSDVIGQAINAINSTQSQADVAATQLVSGNSTDIHSVMIAMEKAKVTFDMAVQVRNKTLDAYTELMHTQV